MPETGPSGADDRAEVEGAVLAFFAGHPLALLVYRAVDATICDLGPVTHRVGVSQVSFRRRRAFAWVWLPGRWITLPRTETVVSFALRSPLASDRLAQVVGPSPRTWMHHLDVDDPGDVDGELADWLARAYAEAG